MKNEPESGPLNLAPDWIGRRKALLRFFLFLGLAVGLPLLTIAIARYVFGIKVDVDQRLSAQDILIANVILTLVQAVIPTAIMVGATRDSPLAFG